MKNKIITKTTTTTTFKIKLALTIFFSIFSITGFASEVKENNKILTSSIQGVVLLPDGTPAIGAMIGVANINKYVFTDLSGAFIMLKVPIGKQKVDISTIEAEPKTVKIELTKAVHELNVMLTKPNTLMMDEIVVTTKSNGQKIKDMGYSLNLVDTKLAALSSLSSSDILARASGVKLGQSGGMGSNIQFNINGLSGNSIRVFIDGIPIRNYGSSFSLSSIPPSMIERIEIFKGVVPIHLSEDALGGAVNIVMKHSATSNLSAGYSYGSFNTHKADFNGNYRHDKSGFSVGGSAFYNYTDNNYEVWGDPIRITDQSTGLTEKIKARKFHDSYQSAGANANIGFTRTKWADRFILGLLFSDMEKDIQHGATMQVVYGKRKAKQRTQMANLQYSKMDIIKGLDINAFASYSYGIRNIIDTTTQMYDWTGSVKRDMDGNIIHWGHGGGEAGRATLENNFDQNLSGRLNLGYSFLPNHTIRANYLYNNHIRDVEDSMLSEFQQQFLDTKYLSKNIIGVSYDNELFNRKLKMSLFYKRYMQGVNVSDPQIINDVLTPVKIENSVADNGYGGAISYSIIPEVMISVSGESAIRLPDSGELLGDLSQGVKPTYTLLPERSTNFNIGAILGPFAIGSDHEISGDVNFFYRDIRDMIQREMDIDLITHTYGYENLGKVRSIGLDFDMRYSWKERLFFTYNISTFNARFNLQYDENGVEYIMYNSRLRNAPYLTMNSSVRFVKNNLFLRGSQLSIEYNFGYVHEFYRNWEGLGGSNKDTIPTQFVHDIGIVYTFPSRQFSISFDVKNILNEQLFDNWAMQKPGRMFFAKVSYNMF